MRASTRGVLRSLAAAGAGYGAGSIPFSNLVARRVAGVDLRSVGSGTVSGTSLYRQSGFGPLVVGGVADVAKGSVGPLVAGRDRPVAAAAAGALAVVGHNWSPWLGGAGGRGISPAMGALLVRNQPGAAVLLGGIALGRVFRSTALGALASYLALVPVLRRTRGRPGALAGGAVLVPVIVKRLLGNAPPDDRRPVVYLWRLLYDRDTREPLDHAVAPPRLEEAA